MLYDAYKLKKSVWKVYKNNTLSLLGTIFIDNENQTMITDILHNFYTLHILRFCLLFVGLNTPVLHESIIYIFYVCLCSFFFLLRPFFIKDFPTIFYFENRIQTFILLCFNLLTKKNVININIALFTFYF